jgi:hypothetical protein
MPTAPLPPDVADPLYAVPPAKFVAARNALAKQLRAEGNGEQAALVAGLRRPTPGAGALNQVARRQPDLVTAALEAGAALLAATDEALGGDASTLRAATADDRAATKALSDAVAEVLALSPADVAQRVTATVRAAMTSPAVAAALRTGRLDVDHEPGGFGLGGGEVAPAPRADELAPRRQAKADKAAKERAQRDAEERRARQRRRVEHEKRVLHLEAKATRLAAVAAEAEETAALAREAADTASAELEAARAADPED